VVVVGGVRRAARLAVKHCADPGALRFVEFKRRMAHRDDWGMVRYWSANMSVGADAEFWAAVEKVGALLRTPYAERARRGVIGSSLSGREIEGAVYDPILPEEVPGATERELHAANVFLAASACAYYDETGEPGFINL